MIRIRIDPDNSLEPTIIQMAPLLEGNREPVLVRWSNKPEEVKTIERFRDQDITLVVKDVAAMERTASTLGLHFDYPHDKMLAMERAFEDSARWRPLVASLSPAASRGLLIALLDSSIRKGGAAKRERAVLSLILFEGVSPFDFDVLYRLDLLVTTKP